MVLAAIGAAFYAQNRANNALRREMADLRAEVRRALATPARSPALGAQGAAAAPNVVLQIEAGDAGGLNRVREAVEALPASRAEMTQLASSAQSALTTDTASAMEPAAAIGEGPRTPASEMRNRGRATPAATIETALWAAFTGNVEVLAGALMFSAEIQAKADGWFAGLAESLRREHGSPEKLIAAVLAREAAELRGMQVLGGNEVSANEVNVRVLVAAGGGRTKEETFVTRRSDGGWKMVPPDEMVEKLARKISDR